MVIFDRDIEFGSFLEITDLFEIVIRTYSYELMTLHF